jgi:hypothetical protein
VKINHADILKYVSTGVPASAGNKFQDLPRLRETADNTKSCIKVIFVKQT